MKFRIYQTAPDCPECGVLMMLDSSDIAGQFDRLRCNNQLCELHHKLFKRPWLFADYEDITLTADQQQVPCNICGAQEHTTRNHPDPTQIAASQRSNTMAREQAAAIAAETKQLHEAPNVDDPPF